MCKVPPNMVMVNGWQPSTLLLYSRVQSAAKHGDGDGKWLAAQHLTFIMVNGWQPSTLLLYSGSEINFNSSPCAYSQTSKKRFLMQNKALSARTHNLFIGLQNYFTRGFFFKGTYNYWGFLVPNYFCFYFNFFWKKLGNQKPLVN